MDLAPEYAEWREKIVENKEAVQDEVARLYSEGQITEEARDAALADISMIINAEVSNDAVISKAKLWVGYAVAVAILAIIFLPPASEIYVALAVYMLVVYAFDDVPGGEGSLAVEQLVDALAERLSV